MIEIGSYVRIESSGILGFVVDINDITQTCIVEDESAETEEGNMVFYDCPLDDIRIAN